MKFLLGQIEVHESGLKHKLGVQFPFACRLMTTAAVGLLAQTTKSRRTCLWLVLATLGTTVASSLISDFEDSIMLGIAATVLLLVVNCLPWSFKIHGDTPVELLYLSDYFKPVLIALTVVVALASMGGGSDTWSAISSLLMVSTALLPLRKKLLRA